MPDGAYDVEHDIRDLKVSLGIEEDPRQKRRDGPERIAVRRTAYNLVLELRREAAKIAKVDATTSELHRRLDDHAGLVCCNNRRARRPCGRSVTSEPYDPQPMQNCRNPPVDGSYPA